MLVGNYFYNYALNTKQEKEFLEDNPHLVETVNASGDVLATNEEKDVNF
ncbi:alpha/beta hydrolase, partial [Vibrio sp. Vb2942]